MAQWNVNVQATDTTAEMETSDPKGTLNVALDTPALSVMKDGAWVDLTGAGGGPHKANHEPGGSDALTSLDVSSFAPNRGPWIRVADSAGRTGLGAVREGQLVFQADTDVYYKSTSVDGTDAASVVWVDVGTSASAASETAAGVVEQATEAEVQAGTAGNLFATVARLKAELDRREQVVVSAPSWTNYNVTIPLNTWTRLNNGTANLPQITVPALGAAPTGYKWVVTTRGFIRLVPTGAGGSILVNVALNNGAMAGTNGGALVTGDRLVPLLATLDVPTPTASFTVDFGIFGAADTYTVATSSRPEANCYLVKV